MKGGHEALNRQAARSREERQARRDADTAAAIQRSYKLLRGLHTKVDQMGLDISALTAKIDRTVGIEESALALIQEMRAEIASLNDANTGDTGTMQAAIDALTSKLDAGGVRLAAAVAGSPTDTGTATTAATEATTGAAPGEAGTVADDPASVAAAEQVPQELHPGQPTPGVLDGSPNPPGTAASQQIPPADAT